MTSTLSPAAMRLKAALFLFAGGLASLLLLADTPTLRTGFLLAVAVWSFARAYYFAFYVLEHYVDPTFRYTGLIDLIRNARTRPSAYARKR